MLLVLSVSVAAAFQGVQPGRTPPRALRMQENFRENEPPQLNFPRRQIVTFLAGAAGVDLIGRFAAPKPVEESAVTKVTRDADHANSVAAAAKRVAEAEAAYAARLNSMADMVKQFEPELEALKQEFAEAEAARKESEAARQQLKARYLNLDPNDVSTIVIGGLFALVAGQAIALARTSTIPDAKVVRAKAMEFASVSPVATASPVATLSAAMPLLKRSLPEIVAAELSVTQQMVMPRISMPMTSISGFGKPELALTSLSIHFRAARQKRAEETAKAAWLAKLDEPTAAQPKRSLPELVAAELSVAKRLAPSTGFTKLRLPTVLDSLSAPHGPNVKSSEAAPPWPTESE